MLIPAWNKRAELLRKEAKEIVDAYERLDPPNQENSQVPAGEEKRLGLTGNQKRQLQTAVASIDSAGKFIPLIRRNPTQISYNLTRLGRLAEPRAGALLQAYAQFLIRPAFDHDFEKKS